MDAENESESAPGIAEFHPPPYFAWHAAFSPFDVKAAHGFLTTVVEEDGPYDGVIGFSEGAALAASFLLSHQASDESVLRLPFKLAVFFNAVLVLSPSDELGSKIPEDEAYNALSMFVKQSGMPGGGDEERVQHNSPGADVYYGFNPDTIKHRISIPTLHVVGSNDQYAPYSRSLLKLCDPTNANVVTSHAAHELPRADALDAVAHRLDIMILTASLES